MLLRRGVVGGGALYHLSIYIYIYIIIFKGGWRREGVPDLVILEIFERDIIQPGQFLRQIFLQREENLCSI